MPFVSNYVRNNQRNFHLQLLRRFKDMAVFVVGSFSLPHTVVISTMFSRQSTALVLTAALKFCLRLVSQGNSCTMMTMMLTTKLATTDRKYTNTNHITHKCHS